MSKVRLLRIISVLTSKYSATSYTPAIAKIFLAKVINNQNKLFSFLLKLIDFITYIIFIKSKQIAFVSALIKQKNI